MRYPLINATPTSSATPKGIFLFLWMAYYIIYRVFVNISPSSDSQGRMWSSAPTTFFIPCRGRQGELPVGQEKVPWGMTTSTLHNLYQSIIAYLSVCHFPNYENNHSPNFVDCSLYNFVCANTLVHCE